MEINIHYLFSMKNKSDQSNFELEGEVSAKESEECYLVEKQFCLNAP